MTEVWEWVRLKRKPSFLLDRLDRLDRLERRAGAKRRGGCSRSKSEQKLGWESHGPTTPGRSWPGAAMAYTTNGSAAWSRM